MKELVVYCLLLCSMFSQVLTMAIDSVEMRNFNIEEDREEAIDDCFEYEDGPYRVLSEGEAFPIQKPGHIIHAYPCYRLWFDVPANTTAFLSCSEFNLSSSRLIIRRWGPLEANVSNLPREDREWTGTKSPVLEFSSYPQLYYLDFVYRPYESARNDKLRCSIRGEASLSPSTTTTSTTSVFGSEECSCGLANGGDSADRIVNGEEALPNEFPWLVSLRYRGHVICGGTLVSDQWILTAAHCLKRGTVNDYSVILGEHRIVDDDGTEEHPKVAELVMHPLYKYEKKSFVTGGRDNFIPVYDYALLKLQGKLYKSHKTCLPAKGPWYFLRGRAGRDERVGAVVEKDVVWALLRIAKRTPKVDGTKNRDVSLSEGADNFASAAQILASDDCAGDPVLPPPPYKPFHLRETIDESMMCAYREGSFVCNGDSGGPLVTRDSSIGRYTVVGVTSWAAGIDPFSHRCIGNFPDVYARVTTVLDWIKLHVGTPCNV